MKWGSFNWGDGTFWAEAVSSYTAETASTATFTTESPTTVTFTEETPTTVVYT